jgi:hypothetical protein
MMAVNPSESLLAAATRCGIRAGRCFIICASERKEANE